MAQLTEVLNHEDWKTLLETSHTKPLLLIKHSTTCPISGNAWNEFHKFLETADSDKVTNAFVKVIESRPTSLAIAEETGVRHESPQAILFKNGTAVWSTSHYDITAKALQEVVQ